ncbi:MAG: transcription antitermination factor NusB [Planctomycetota bacterium]|jgi:16S rRNA (cytosine967-C5)-methyltransferase
MRPDRSNPRGLALAALCDRAGNVTAHLDRLLAEHAPEPRTAHLAWELAMGVVRRRGTLDAVISAFQKRAGAYMPQRIRQVLRLGAYQILFLDRIPVFAAVNEAVEQAGTGRMRGFVNALLRNIDRPVSPPESGRPVPAADVLAVGPDRCRRFDRPVFDDPAESPAGYLASAYSLPAELAARWLADRGGLDAVIRRALHANARPPAVLRVNSLRASVDHVLDRLSAQGIESAAHANGLSVVITGHADLRSLDVLAEGLVQPQDASATAVVAAAPVGPGMQVLDLCAAPGTKTTHLAERMGNRGRIVAADVSDEKLARVTDNCRRMGVEIVETVPAEQVGSFEADSFDLVLVDAPCSNTGVLARRPEARWRFRAEELDRLARDQRHLLALGAEFVRPGGSLVYSTCSMEAEENERVVRALTGQRGEFRVRDQRRTEPAGAGDPTRWSDGGAFAVLRR